MWDVFPCPSRLLSSPSSSAFQEPISVHDIDKPPVPTWVPQSGDAAEGGKREENGVRAFLFLASSLRGPSQLLCISTEATGAPKWLTLRDFIFPESCNCSHLWTLPVDRWEHVCCYQLWITALSLCEKCLSNYPTLSVLPDNGKWQKWYWSPRLLVLGVESVLHTHLTFIHMLIKLLSTKRKALCWAQAI